MPEDRVLSRIQGLYAKATGPGTTAEEAKTYMDKAEELMLKHTIDRATIEENACELDEITSSDWDLPGEGYREVVQGLMLTVMRHCKLQVATYHSKFTVVGFASDIQYGELLWTTIYAEFAGSMWPRWNHAVSFDVNVYNIKKAQLTWREIQAMARAEGFIVPDGSSRLGSAQRRELLRRGEPVTRQTQRHAAWRASYAAGFQAVITSRLMGMRERAESKLETSHTDRYALAVIDNSARVKAEFYRLYPQFDPEYILRQHDARAAEDELWWNSLSSAEKAKHTETANREYDRRMRESQRAERNYDRMRTRNYDPAGWAHGTEAGEKVDLNLGSNRLKDKKALGG